MHYAQIQLAQLNRSYLLLVIQKRPDASKFLELRILFIIRATPRQRRSQAQPVLQMAGVLAYKISNKLFKIFLYLYKKTLIN